MVSAYNQKQPRFQMAPIPSSRPPMTGVSRERSSSRPAHKKAVTSPPPPLFSFNGERKFVVIPVVNLHGPVSPLALRWRFGGESLSRRASEQGRNAGR